MNENIKVKLIDAILADYYECGYEASAAEAIINVIFTIINFEEKTD